MAPAVKLSLHDARHRIALALFSVAAGTVSAQEVTPPAPATLPSSRTPQVAVTDRGTVELHVSNLSLATVLQLLSMEGKRNIIASPAVKGTVTANLYDSTFEEALQAILVTNGAGYRNVGNYIFVNTKEELAEISEASNKELSTRVFSLNYITAAELKPILDPLIGKDGSVTASQPAAKGIKSEVNEGGGQNHASNDFVVVTTKHTVMTEVARIIKEIDVRPRQVLIEATILRATLEDNNALGIDFTMVGGVDLEELGATSNGVQDVTLGQLPQNRFELGNASATTGFTENVPNGGLHIGIIKDKVAVFLKALEQVTDTTVLANPKVLTLNKQKGQVIVGRRDGFLTTTVTETQAVQTVQYLETGTQLIFRPFIGDDGYVRVELHPEDSVGFVSAQGLPSEQTTEVTTNVMVRDGDTILIGGLFRELTTDGRSQIPGLGSIPGVGQLFRSNNDSSQREEVIILLTLHIVKDQDAYVDASRKAFEDVEKMRVGLREGLMWHGKERLAQHNYRKALEHMKNGEECDALFYTNLALHCNPRMTPAIELKDRLNGEHTWEADGTAGREFIYHLIAKENHVPMPFNRPESTESAGEVQP